MNLPPKLSARRQNPVSNFAPKSAHDRGNIAIDEDEVLKEEKEDEFDSETILETFKKSSARDKKDRYSPLNWENYFDESFDVEINNTDTFHVYRAGNRGPILFCLHGAGFSGLSFALSAQKMKKHAQIYAMDFRGHGLTKCENELDLSEKTLCNDVASVINKTFENDLPAIVLIGHSMGGAIAAKIVSNDLIQNVYGLIIIDVVEGTAMASLLHMKSILENRPKFFPSISNAIEWFYHNGTVRNLESAKISVSSLFKWDEQNKKYSWRTDLESSEKYWKEWYENLSETFLSCTVPKLLLLAGTDRLDRPLTIAQMQGKFQMIVMRHSGHNIQEDEADEFASTVLSFVSRNRIASHGLNFTGFSFPVHSSMT